MKMLDGKINFDDDDEKDYLDWVTNLESMDIRSQLEVFHALMFLQEEDDPLGKVLFQKNFIFLTKYLNKLDMLDVWLRWKK